MRKTLLTALFSAALVTLSPTGASADPAGGLAMDVRAGDAAAPSVVLTNRTGSPCQIADTALGTIGVTSVTQGGRAVTAIATDPSFPDSLANILAAHLVTLAPGASKTIPLLVLPYGGTGAAIETVSWSPDASLGAVFPVKKGEAAAVTATYALPPLTVTGPPPCPPATAGNAEAPPAVDHDGMPIWILFAAVVAFVLLVVALVLLGRRSRRAAARGAAAFLLLAATGVALLGTARPASATVTVDPSLKGDFAKCLPIFQMAGGDPAGIFGSLNDPKSTVQIIPANGDQTHEISVAGTIIIFWDVNDRHAYTGGGNASPCDSLYHEAYHGWEDLHGGQDHSPCVTDKGNSGLPVNEVNATKAQNKLRVKLGDTPRKTYGDTPLPAGDCLPKDKQPKPKGNCAGAGCGDSNGDPHLRTFDGERYDFQAVGEFVAAVDGDFQVQVRQQPAGTSTTVAMTTAAAMSVAGDRVEVDLDVETVKLLVDGAPVALDAAGSLPHGGRVTFENLASPPQIVVTWPDGSNAYISVITRYALHVTVQPSAVHAGKVSGLLGDFNGDHAADLRTAGGQKLPDPPAFGDLYPKFADSWRIKDSTSLFTYPSGASTATYTDRSRPAAPPDVTRMAGAAAAEAFCVRIGLEDAVAKANCVLDVAETGQAAFGFAALSSQAIAASASGSEPGPGPTSSASLGVTRHATLTVTQPRGTADLTFDGVAGQRVFVDFTSPKLRSECGVIDLVSPDGATIDEGCLDANGHGTMGGTLLRAGGKWKLRFVPRDPETGTLDLTVTFTTDVHGTIPVDGSPVTVAIASPGQVASLDFDGIVAQRVLVEVSGSTLPSACGVPSLIAPDGSTASLGCLAPSGTGLLDATPLRTSGRFSVVVDPAEGATGQVTLRLIVTEDQRGTIAVGGPAVTATIARPGQISRFTFTAVNGGHYHIDVTGATIPSQCGVPGVRDPLGTEFTEGCVDATGQGQLDFTTNSGGTYTIEVDPADLGTGTVTVRLRR